jgi:tRNA threonylcarbamoyladenosine biosynthesis protein TsaB
MKILALETSTDACSVALWVDGVLLERHEILPRQHTQVILNWIAILLSEAELKLQQLTAIAYGRGPGSFTGVGVGAGIVLGLAFGTDLPVITVSSLCVLAQSAYASFEKKRILVAQDARMHEIYWGCYQLNDYGIMESAIPERVCSPTQVFIPDIADDWSLVGNACSVYPELLSLCKSHGLATFSKCYPHARDVAIISREYFKQGLMTAPEKALPIYLRGCNTWKKLTPLKRN